MKERVFEYIRKNHMIAAGDEIVAGVSGGADSVCLLFLLQEYRKKVPYHLTCVHVNHMIRKDAPRDAEYVRILCENWQIPFVLVSRDVKKFASERKISEEEAGRMIRYQAFENAFSEEGSNTGKICVAHTMNDNAETVLFHLFRGSGISGLCGIRNTRGEVIRPLLCVERDEIERYLKENHIDFCMDSTNAGDDYTRNKIRHHILPYASREINSGTVAHINEAARQLEETERFLKKLTDHAYLEYVTENIEGGTIEIADNLVHMNDSVIVAGVLRQCIQRLAECEKDITSAHIKDLTELFDKDVSKKRSLPYKIEAVKGYNSVCLSTVKGSDESETNFRDLCEELDFGKTIRIAGTGFLNTKVFDIEKMPEIEQKTYTKWFDYDKISDVPIIRTCRKGDYLVINDAGQKQNFNRFCINNKIPADQRDRMVLLADGDHIMWILGYRISAYYKLNAQTKKVMEAHLDGGM